MVVLLLFQWLFVVIVPMVIKQALFVVALLFQCSFVVVSFLIPLLHLDPETHNSKHTGHATK